MQPGPSNQTNPHPIKIFQTKEKSFILFQNNQYFKGKTFLCLFERKDFLPNEKFLIHTYPKKKTSFHAWRKRFLYFLEKPHGLPKKPNCPTENNFLLDKEFFLAKVQVCRKSTCVIFYSKIRKEHPARKSEVCSIVYLLGKLFQPKC